MITASTSELRRLYEIEGLTLQQIADRFGVSRQAVHERLKRNGFNPRSRGTPKQLDRELVIDLYVKQSLPVLKIAKMLKVTDRTVSRALIRYGVAIRPKGRQPLDEYQPFRTLALNESIVAPLPKKKQPYVSLYAVCAHAGIRIKVKKQGGGLWKVTRVG
jgi:transposase